MHMRLQKLQETDLEAQEIRATQLQKGWEEVDRVLHHQKLSYVPKIVRFKLISKHHNDPVARYFGINKTQELLGQKYY